MRSIAITFGMMAAVALANPAEGALPLPHGFFHEHAPTTTPVDLGTYGNPRHDAGPIVDDVLDNPDPPIFQPGSDRNGFQLGGNGVPVFNVRFDPENDFYYRLTAQIASVPESSTWMMLLLGFAAIGFAMRRTREAKPNRASV